MEGDVYHRTDHPDLVDRGIYLSFYHERIAKCHFPVLPFDCYRYGCGRRYRGFGKHHETHRTGKCSREAAKYGTNEVWLSVIVTTLVTVAVFFPLTLVTGMTGILFKQLGYIVCITVCTSTVTAISLTPMLSSQLLRLQDKDTQKKESKFSYNSTVMRLLDKLDAWYERLIRWSLYHKTTITLTAVVIFVASMFLAKYISTDFMPQNDQGSMNVYVKMQTGQRVEETKRVALQIDSIMRANYPEIRQINLSYGSEDEDAGFSSLFNKTGSNILNIRARFS